MRSNPPTYRVELERAVLKTLRNLPKNIVSRLQQAIDTLVDNPRPVGCIRLQSKRELYRVRVGDWRIIYTINNDELLVVVVDVGSRGGVYRKY